MIRDSILMQLCVVALRGYLDSYERGLVSDPIVGDERRAPHEA